MAGILLVIIYDSLELNRDMEYTYGGLKKFRNSLIASEVLVVWTNLLLLLTHTICKLSSFSSITFGVFLVVAVAAYFFDTVIFWGGYTANCQSTIF